MYLTLGAIFSGLELTFIVIFANRSLASFPDAIDGMQDHGAKSYHLLEVAR